MAYLSKLMQIECAFQADLSQKTAVSGAYEELDALVASLDSQQLNLAETLTLTATTSIRTDLLTARIPQPAEQTPTSDLLLSGSAKLLAVCGSLVQQTAFGPQQRTWTNYHEVVKLNGQVLNADEEMRLFGCGHLNSGATTECAICKVRAWEPVRLQRE